MIQSLFDETDENLKERREEIAHSTAKDISAQPEVEIKELAAAEEKNSPEIRVFDDSNIREEKPFAAETENYGFPVLAEIPAFSEINDQSISTANALQIDQKDNEPAVNVSFLNSTEPENQNSVRRKAENEQFLFKMPFAPESTAETARNSGLAWAAAIALFGSVVFCLIIGWFADLLLGTSPWGIVGGIVLGSIVGFLQFFRMTSQILKK